MTPTAQAMGLFQNSINNISNIFAQLGAQRRAEAEAEAQRQWQEQQMAEQQAFQQKLIEGERAYNEEQYNQRLGEQAQSYGAAIPFFEQQGVLPQGAGEWFAQQPVSAQVGLGEMFSPILQQRAGAQYERELSDKDMAEMLRGQAIGSAYLEQYGPEGASQALMQAMDSGEYTTQELVGMYQSGKDLITNMLDPMYEFQLKAAEFGVELTEEQLNTLRSGGMRTGGGGGGRGGGDVSEQPAPEGQQSVLDWYASQPDEVRLAFDAAYASAPQWMSEEEALQWAYVEAQKTSEGPWRPERLPSADDTPGYTKFNTHID